MEFIGTILGAIWSNVFYNPILNMLIVFYEVGFQNLGLAVLLMVGVIKLATGPLTKNQVEGAQKLQEIRPQLEEIQKKYAKDPLVFQKKQQELYKKAGYKPLGCFASLAIQLPVLIALYSAVRNFSEGKIEGIYPFVVDLFNLGAKITVNTQFLIWDFAKSFNSVSKEFGQFSVEVLPYLLLAVMVGVAQYFSTRFATGSRPKPNKPAKPVNKKAGSDEQIDPNEMMEQVNKSMQFTMPVVVGFTALSLPAVLGYYWILSSVAQIIQQFIIGDRNFILNKIRTRFNELFNINSNK